MADKTIGSGVLSKLLNISVRRVNQLAKDGVLTRADDGHFLLHIAVPEYCRYLQDVNAGGEAASDLKAEQTRLTKLKADQAEIELEKAASEIFLAEDVESLMIANNTAIRARMLTVPGKVRMLNPEVTKQMCSDMEAVILEALGDAAMEDEPGDILARLA